MKFCDLCRAESLPITGPEGVSLLRIIHAERLRPAPALSVIPAQAGSCRLVSPYQNIRPYRLLVTNPLAIGLLKPERFLETFQVGSTR